MAAQPIPPLDDTNLSVMDKFRALPLERRKRNWAKLSEAEQQGLAYAWPLWARSNQQLPPGDWTTWLVQAGRGYGKTRVGAETVRIWKEQFPIVNIIAPTNGDLHKVIIDGPAGLLATAPPWDQPKINQGTMTAEWKNGARTLMFSAEEPERLRGPQGYKLWCDELAAWKYQEKAWDNAMFGLRLGKAPQVIVTTTPRPTKLIKRIIADAHTVVTRGTTFENRHNLADLFLRQIITKYQGTRLGRQELNAELLEDNPGAFWQLAQIDEDRVEADKFWKEIFPTLARIVGGIDPAVTSNADSDETGIVFTGIDKQTPPHYYVFDDRSGIYTPEAWARAAVAGYRQFKADRLIGEVNNGGEMVESTLRHADVNVSYRAVHASKGKLTRAEPISALYEQHRVHHVGTLSALEDQMCDYDPATATFSPDRMDAMVWAMIELSEHDQVLGLVEHYKTGQAQVAYDKLVAPVDVPAQVTALLRDEPKVTCPTCASTVTQIIPGGQRRCQECGAQFGAVKTSMYLPGRKEFSMTGGSRAGRH